MDKENVLELVRKAYEARGTSFDLEYVIPESFDDISKEIADKIGIINKLQKKKLIVPSDAIELMVNLFESDAAKTKYKQFTDEKMIKKYNKLYELLDTSYQDLLNALNKSLMNPKEFMTGYIKLRNKEVGIINEIINIDKEK